MRLDENSLLTGSAGRHGSLATKGTREVASSRQIILDNHARVDPTCRDGVGLSARSRKGSMEKGQTP